MQDNISQNAQQTESKMYSIYSLMIQTAGSFIGAFAGVVKVLADNALVKNRPIDDMLKDQVRQTEEKKQEFLNEADRLPVKDIAGFLPDKSKAQDLIDSAASPDGVDKPLLLEARNNYALSKTGDWYKEKFGNDLAVQAVGNKDVMLFEAKLSACRINFEMLPMIDEGRTSTCYLIEGKDREKVKAIAESFEFAETIKTPEMANEFFHNEHSKAVYYLNGMAKTGRIENLMKSLSDDGIETYLRSEPDSEGKRGLVIRAVDFDDNRNLLIASCTAAAAVEGTRMQKEMDRLRNENSVRIKSTLQNIIDTGSIDEIKDKSFTVYDGPCPDRYIKFMKNGYAREYDNRRETIDLDMSDRADAMHAKKTIGSYIMPVITEKDIKAMSLEEKTRPFAEYSLLNQVAAKFEQHVKDEELRQLKLSAKQVELEHGTDGMLHPTDVNNVNESIESFVQTEDARDTIDNADLADESEIMDLIEDPVDEISSPEKIKAVAAKVRETGKNITIDDSPVPYRPIVSAEPEAGDQILALGDKEKGHDRDENIIDNDHDGIDDRDEDHDGDGIADAYDDHDDRDDDITDDEILDAGDFDNGFDPSDFGE